MNIGLDLGGTKIEIIAIGDSGDIIGRKRIPTPRGDYNLTLNAIADLVIEFTDLYGEIQNIGIGIPGIICQDEGVVKNSNALWMVGHPFKDDLEKILKHSVFMANDANCMTLSEAVDGAGAGHSVVFAAILGTGCGGGISINNQIHAGGNGVAGEWGHNCLPWMTDEEFKYAKHSKCYCGKSGCIETFISGTGFASYYNYCNKQNLTAPEIRHLAIDGDKLALHHLDLLETHIAKSLATVINLLDPDIIILAGGVSNITSIYPGINKKIRDYAVTNNLKLTVVQAKHGDSSGVRGAAWLSESSVTKNICFN